MWSCPSLAGRWPAPHSLWEPAASGQPAVPRAEAPMASPAASPLRDGLNLGARSTPAPADAEAAGESAAAPPRGAQTLTRSAAQIWIRIGAPSAIQHAARGAVRPDRAEPAERADWKGFPDRFCLWIPKYWGVVLTFFS